MGAAECIPTRPSYTDWWLRSRSQVGPPLPAASAYRARRRLSRRRVWTQSLLGLRQAAGESIHFATTRHESTTVLNDVISVTASMQAQETKWNNSNQALSANPGCGEFQPSSTNLSHCNIDDPLLLSDYPTQEGSDLPAMRAWISASTSPPMRNPIHCVGPIVALDRDGTRSVMSDQPCLIRAEGCPMDT